MVDRQIQLRDELLRVLQDYISADPDSEVILRAIEAATSCMGAAAFMLGLMPEHLRDNVIEPLLDQFPLTVAKRAIEIRRGDHDRSAN
jgi:hypothetical protein